MSALAIIGIAVFCFTVGVIVMAMFAGGRAAADGREIDNLEADNEALRIALADKARDFDLARASLAGPINAGDRWDGKA